MLTTEFYLYHYDNTNIYFKGLDGVDEFKKYVPCLFQYTGVRKNVTPSTIGTKLTKLNLYVFVLSGMVSVQFEQL